MSATHCPHCQHKPLVDFLDYFKCPRCEISFSKVFLDSQRITDIQLEKASLRHCVQALKMIAEYGGTQFEGVSCNGTWCAEQASAALRNAGVKHE